MLGLGFCLGMQYKVGLNEKGNITPGLPRENFFLATIALESLVKSEQSFFIKG